MIPGSRHTHMNQIMSIIDEISMIPGSRHTCVSLHSTPYCCELSRKTVNTNFIIFGFT